MPVAGKGVPPPGWLTMTDAVAHTGIPPMTLRRRVDAWINKNAAKIASGYAVKGVRVFGGRLVDEVDAERARLQHAVLLESAVTAEQWAGRVRAGDVPAGVTEAPWWAEAVQRLRDQPPSDVS